jgi:ParB family chromosome partitioning protein
MNAKTTTKPAPLGRGLSALFGDADASYKPRNLAGSEAAPSSEPGDNVQSPKTIPIEWVQPGAFQPRRRFDEDAIKGLADSIRERGILQPLMVRPVEGERNAYEIIAGERRWRAAQLVGLHEVPVIVRPLSDREALEIGLIENVQRQDLSPFEEAEGYRRLMDEFRHSPDGLAKVVGKSRPHISNMLRLLALPIPVKIMVEAGQLTIGHVRPLITAKDPVGLAEEIVKKGMSVRQAEALAKRAAMKEEGMDLHKFLKGDKGNKSLAPNADILALENALGRAIGLKVKIHTQGPAGSLTIYYKNLGQLDGVIKRFQ